MPERAEPAEFKELPTMVRNAVLAALDWHIAPTPANVAERLRLDQPINQLGRLGVRSVVEWLERHGQTPAYRSRFAPLPREPATVTRASVEAKLRGPSQLSRAEKDFLLGLIRYVKELK